jgi:hypothetical protein
MKKPLLFIALILMLSSCTEYKYYTVEVTYCDNRPKDTVVVKEQYRPNNSSIQNYKMAVPKWRGKLNVCNIKCID